MRFLLSGLMIFVLCSSVASLANGQEHSITAKSRHVYLARGQVLALKFMQIQLILHIAQTNGLDAARDLLSVAEDTFEEHLKSTLTDTEEQFSGLPKSIRKKAMEAARRVGQLHRQGGNDHFDSLHVVFGVLESEMKKR